MLTPVAARCMVNRKAAEMPHHPECHMEQRRDTLFVWPIAGGNVGGATLATLHRETMRLCAIGLFLMSGGIVWRLGVACTQLVRLHVVYGVPVHVSYAHLMFLSS